MEYQCALCFQTFAYKLNGLNLTMTWFNVTALTNGILITTPNSFMNFPTTFSWNGGMITTLLLASDATKQFPVFIDFNAQTAVQIGNLNGSASVGLPAVEILPYTFSFPILFAIDLLFDNVLKFWLVVC